MEKESILFTPGKIGPLTLRNRTIRAAAFESMWLLRKADFLSNVSSGCAQISSPD